MDERKSRSPLGPDADRVRTEIKMPPQFREALNQRCLALGVPLATFMVLAAAQFADQLGDLFCDDELLAVISKQLESTQARIRARTSQRRKAKAIAARRQSQELSTCAV